MPRNASGTYSLPVAAYVAGTTIRSADMNSNLSDIGTALTQSLATTGVSSMTGPIKLSAGSLAAPGLTLASDTGTGWYNSAAGTWVYVSGGVAILTVSPTGIVLNTGTLTVGGNLIASRLVGEIVDYGGTSAPTGWLLCFGQAVSRSTYSALFAITGTAFGVGDGSTTFNLPDLRGRITVGKDNMGGSTAGRITVAGGNFDATVLGAVGGAQNHTMLTAEMVQHNHGGTSGAGGNHTHTALGGGSFVDNSGSSSISGGGAGLGFAATTSSSGTHTHTISNEGSTTAFTILNPVQVVNKIIYTGV